MNKLTNILYKVAIEAVVGTTQISVSNIHFDSRLVELNDVFVAIPGVQAHGHDFISKAVKKGALVVVCEDLPVEQVNGVSYVVVKDTQVALAMMASKFSSKSIFIFLFYF